MDIIFGFVGFILFIVLIIGLIQPTLILRWSKKPTHLKVIGYTLLSYLLLIIIMGIVGTTPATEKNNIKDSANEIKSEIETPSVDIPKETEFVDNTDIQEDIETNLNYGIITKKIVGENRITINIRAFYDTTIYKKENIEKVLLEISNSAKNEVAKNKEFKIVIFLYSSEKSQVISTGVDWIARSIYGFGAKNKIDIDYSNDKINRLNTNPPIDYTEFNELLIKEHNTNVCEIRYQMALIAQNALNDADKKFGKNYSNERLDFEEKREREGIAKLLVKYNIPDSLDYKISAYSIYCK